MVSDLGLFWLIQRFIFCLDNYYFKIYMCDVERLESIEVKLDAILENQMKLFAILSGVLVEADYLTKVIGLNKNTISKNKKLKKFNRIGGRKILLKLESVPVLKSMRKPRRRPRSK